jgi:uncharacterized membrane protein
VLGAESQGRPGLYRRGTEEFSRVLAFSDGVFAIAMTLLVVGIAVPTLGDADSVGELADALNDLTPSFVSFFISFAVIGRYWAARHEFVGLLEWMDRRTIAINLVYLAFIAFLPFPTALLGNYFENPLSVALYAFIVAIVSGLEVVSLRHSQCCGLMRHRPAQPPKADAWAGRLGAAGVTVLPNHRKPTPGQDASRAAD